MNRVFILGSGFSKAINDGMPLTKDLSFILEKIRQTESSLSTLEMADFHRLSDFEIALSYLAQDIPWKDKEIKAAHSAIFEKIVKIIFREIRNCENSALDIDRIPDWFQNFIRFLFKSKSTVITFNYDTLLERSAMFTLRPDENINFDWMYPKIMTNVKYLDHVPRLGSSVPQHAPFPFIKLHGSINWFYTGEGMGNGQQFFFVPFESESPGKDFWKFQDYLIDKEPLLIPPVAEKSPYYASGLVKTLWRQAHRAIKEANELYFMGYSLPEADLTTRLLLSAVSPAARVMIVNTATSETKDVLLNRYKRAMPHVHESFFSTEWIGENPIQQISNDTLNWGWWV